MPVFEEDGLVSGIFDTNQRKRAYAMFADFQGYDWVLPIHYYRDEVDLIALLQVKVIIPAEQKAEELDRQRRNF